MVFDHDQFADCPALIREHDIDALISDYLMAGMTGLDVIESVRDAGINIPILILSGNPFAIDRQRAKRLGVAEIFSKPPDLKKIVPHAFTSGGRWNMKGSNRCLLFEQNSTLWGEVEGNPKGVEAFCQKSDDEWSIHAELSQSERFLNRLQINVASQGLRDQTRREIDRVTADLDGGECLCHESESGSAGSDSTEGATNGDFADLSGKV